MNFYPPMPSPITDADLDRMRTHPDEFVTNTNGVFWVDDWELFCEECTKAERLAFHYGEYSTSLTIHGVNAGWEAAIRWVAETLIPKMPWYARRVTMAVLKPYIGKTHSDIFWPKKRKAFVSAEPLEVAP